jgi:hypothetical protein
VSFKAVAVSAEDDVGGRVVGVGVHGVGAVEMLRRGEADVEDLPVADADFGHAGRT